MQATGVRVSGVPGSAVREAGLGVAGDDVGELGQRAPLPSVVGLTDESEAAFAFRSESAVAPTGAEVGVAGSLVSGTFDGGGV